ncbi:MAG: hypothetical protein ACI3ZY_00495 [Parabacteroides sp.]
MSKTYLNQVEKTKMLVDGLSANQTLVRNVGISDEQVAELSRIADEAEVLNKAVDDLRAALSVKTREANRKLVELREKTLTAKRVIKRCYEPERWQKFGILDKR